MWIYRDFYDLLSKVLKLLLNGEDVNEVLTTISAYRSLKYNEVIELIELFAKKQIILNQTLDALSKGNYQIDTYLNVLSTDVTSNAINNVISTFKEINDISKSVAMGDFTKYLTIKGEDDKLAISMNQMIDNYKDIVKQAKIIADGDYQADIPPQSEKDELGIALRKMTKHLRELKIFTDNQDWLKSNLNRLSEAISGDNTQIEVAKKAITFIARVVNAGKGALYINENEEMVLKATFAYTKREEISNKFKLGEGVVGQVALEKSPILLKNIKRDESVIATATIIEAPINTYTYPLIYENTLYGVIEIASFEEFSEIKQEFMLESNKIVASYLFASFQREESKRLLKESTNANEKLQVQSEELMSVNAQLEEQQQQLQQQSEELQQSNAQLEELQQQLQQQIEEMQISNDELTKSKIELDKRNRELQEANSYRTQFLANVSHELRTPLNSIILLSKVLSMNEGGRLDSEEIKKATIINDSGNELLKLINDILDLSKVESGSITIHFSKLSTSTIKNDFSDMFEYQAKDKGIEFTIEDNYQKDIYTDKDKFYQILRNVVSNAIKFTKEGSVKLSFEDGDKEYPLLVRVEDTGIGIPNNKLDKVFEPFQQVDGSILREFGGTGLGLAITKDFANRLGIKIELSSELSKGSMFKLHIPRQINFEDENLNMDEKFDFSENYILFLGSDRKIFNLIAKLNDESGLNSVYLSNIENIYKYLKNYIPKAIFINIKDFTSSAEILKELKSIKELENIPFYINEDSFNEDKYKNLLIKLVNSKKLLLFSKEKTNLIDKLRENYINFELINSKDELFNKLKSEKFEAIVINSNEKEFLINILKEINIKVPIIIFSNSEFENNFENDLKKYVKSIIINSPHAIDRLIEEIKLLKNENKKIKKEEISEVANSINLKGKTILVVDDDVTNIYVLSSVFEERGAKVIQAFDGKKAIEKLNEYKIDLILMDIMMPVMDGFEAIKKIRSDNTYKDLPIIAVTAKALKEDRDKCIEVGANDYISKPVDFNVLISLVKAWINKKNENTKE